MSDRKTDNNHKVYINAYGERVMRVTEILSVLAKDQLLVWANMLGFKGVDYKKELERTANIGTMFHGIVEEYMDPKRVAEINYEKYGVFGFKSELEATNAIQSFFNWYEGIKDYYKIAFTEKVVVGERFGGTIDCGIKGFIDKEKVIFVDYKTSTDFYMTQFLQLAGYVEIYEELYGPNTVEGVMVVLAHKKDREPANARIIFRDYLEPFIECFETLYHTALATKTLKRDWLHFTQEVY